VAVKKMKLDFSKVEERSGYNSGHMPEGLHEAKIAEVVLQEAQDGTDMYVFALVPTAAKYKTRRFPFYCKLQQNQLWKLRDLLVAAGIKVPKASTTVDPNKAVGKTIAIEVQDDMYNDTLRSQVQGVYPSTILEDQGAATDDEDDEEDEVDEEEYEDSDEDDEEYEDDEDEEDEDEDEDLDDEELEDDDYEDEEEDEEEEEPEPVRKRKAPAKKAPAKTSAKKPAAKAAPTTKRVVKRR
jgi:TATA-binding protein-associated factor Taf7